METAGRWLQDLEGEGATTATTAPTSTPPAEGALWEMIYVGVVLLIMFAALLSDKFGADLVMLSALTLCMAANIVTIPQGVSGFSNEGVLTVLVLFVVAAGIQLTGGLDWYMSKLLGHPVNTQAAQLRLMIPIAIISAFLNNTPVVVIMIPIVQKWGKNVGIAPSQLLIPLSFASILGGTCTLIGTSTNLVVAGLMEDRYGDNPDMAIGLFDLGEYGVPILFIGMSYVIIASPYLLPGGKRGGEERTMPIDDEDVLLGARLTKWSPAAGRTVKRSGLRDTGGIYLVSVYRAISGNIHRAVGQEFVVNVDDTLYFTCTSLEEFAQFCATNGLEVVTNENLDGTKQDETINQKVVTDQREKTVQFAESVRIDIDTEEGMPPLSIEMKSLPSRSKQQGDKLQQINKLRDVIRGFEPDDDTPMNSQSVSNLSGGVKVVVTVDTQDLEDVVLVGINANDRPGLLLDISRGLHSLGLQLHHTEASVVLNRSLSIWRCEAIDNAELDAEEVRAILCSLLENEGGAGAAKQRGLSVIRAVVTDNSSLLEKTLDDINFRATYKAAIIAVQKKDKTQVETLADIRFGSGDVLVLQADIDSPLLVSPPPDFYEGSSEQRTSAGRTSAGDLIKTAMVGLKLSNSSHDLKLSNDSNDIKAMPSESNETSKHPSAPDAETSQAWIDLRVLRKSDNSTSQTTDTGGNAQHREFLAAVKVSHKSQHINKTVGEAGLDRQAGLHLVGVERPIRANKMLNTSFRTQSVVAVGDNPFGDQSIENASAFGGSVNTSVFGASVTQSSVRTVAIPIPPEGHLKEGDVLWFAGQASAIADLRKIPGLVSLEDEQLRQIDERVHDRRLVQAVVAKSGPLVGKSASETGFRTRYGAAVIAVHRDGTRVQSNPGNIKLQAGDVLLLEAGPTFISRNIDNQRSFALISEVKDSKPPRLDKLIPALVLVGAMLIVVAIGPVLFPEQNCSSLLTMGLLTSIVMVSMDMLSQQECRDAINWEVYITIACAFGIGTAMENCGLAALIANGLVSLGNALGIGVAGLYGSVYLATFLISNIVTNNAAAALMFPIAMGVADDPSTDADPLLMSYNIMLAASASFMSPYGYTTNLLIYGPGGYKVKDFVKLGTPMQVVLWILTTLLLSRPGSWPWYISWFWTLGTFMLTCAVFVFPFMVASAFRKVRKASHLE